LPDTRLVRDGKSLDVKMVGGREFSALSEERLRILSALAKEPHYPAELAKQLGMPAQTAYYHVRSLLKAGLIELVEYQQRQGALAKRFKASAPAFAFVAGEKWKPFQQALQKKAPKFFAPLVENGFFDGFFVVGSPDPHGEYRARGSELCAMELAMSMGSFASFDYPLYLLDTELREEHKKRNLVAIGGPKVNTLVHELNPALPIRFDEGSFDVRSTLSGKKYSENVGIVELVPNPFNKSKKVLVASGRDHGSTRVAILAILAKREKLEEGNAHDRAVIAKVVQGFDEDADGIVDTVEILE
jgi:DNA-binding transcriptional ArsR family regulator